jgi:hypothetical protein
MGRGVIDVFSRTVIDVIDRKFSPLELCHLAELVVLPTTLCEMFEIGCSEERCEMETPCLQHVCKLCSMPSLDAVL